MKNKKILEDVVNLLSNFVGKDDEPEQKEDSKYVVKVGFNVTKDGTIVPIAYWKAGFEKKFAEIIVSCTTGEYTEDYLYLLQEYAIKSGKEAEFKEVVKHLDDGFKEAQKKLMDTFLQLSNEPLDEDDPLVEPDEVLAKKDDSDDEDDEEEEFIR